MANKRQLNNDWRNAIGEIDYPMTNDYMFRMVLQSNELILRGLISSLMHIPFDDMEEVVVENPIELGKYIDDKSFILDIRVRLFDNSIINLEMQVINRHNWEDRSLSYLCRTFDNVQKGQGYSAVNKVTHIGFLDYDLFPQNPEFYASYKMLNVKNYQVYNSKFCLSVLSLNQIDIATDEDKEWHIDEWARLFKFRMWEDIRMVTEKNEMYTEFAKTLYELNSDVVVREMCEARREAEMHEEYINKQLAEKDAAIKEKDKIIKELQEKIKQLEA